MEFCSIIIIIFVLLCNVKFHVCDNEAHLSSDDFKRAKLPNYVKKGGKGALEKGAYFEGDLKGVQPSDITNFVKSSYPLPVGTPRLETAFVENPAYSLWPEARIPYFIAANNFSEVDRATIADSIEVLENRTCLRFVPASMSDKSHIFMFNGDGCYTDSIGMRTNGGRQFVSLGEDCIGVGETMHQLLHIAGFLHEHNRPDRDLYVTINFENVEPSKHGQFQKYSPTEVNTLGEPYDYLSIMHFASDAFAKSPGLITIDAGDKTDMIGQWDRLRPRDVRKINKLYDCEARLCNDIPPPPEEIIGDEKSVCSNSYVEKCFQFRQYKTLTCKQLYGLDKCNYRANKWMKGYCRRSCGMCKGGVPAPCSDQPPPPGIHTCQELKICGECCSRLMYGFCEITCGTCQADQSSADIPS